MQPQPILTDDADDAERGAAQGEGVAGARWSLADREEADQQVQLVRQSHRDGHIGGGDRVSRPARRVVIADGVGHQPLLAVVERVVAAHHALQFGEFADHAGDQVGLGKPSGVACQSRAGADQRGDLLRQAFQPAHPLALGTEFGVEGDVVQQRHARFQAAPCGRGPRSGVHRRNGHAARARCRRSRSRPRPSGSILATKPKYGAAEPSGLRKAK